jgi:CopG family transcriptional regulator / antitoxin EndoAI
VYNESNKEATNIMHQRLNITLPEETVRLIDSIAKSGNRSRLIDQAVREFLRRKQWASLRKQLEEGARRRAKRDLALNEEWSSLEAEAWQKARG